MRGWLAVKQSGEEFEELVVPMFDAEWERRREGDEFAPSLGKVPILWDGECVVWDSLAIIEHLNEKTGNSRFWPTDPAARVEKESFTFLDDDLVYSCAYFTEDDDDLRFTVQTSLQRNIADRQINSEVEIVLELEVAGGDDPAHLRDQVGDEREGDGAGDDPGSHGDEPLDDVVADGDPLEDDGPFGLAHRRAGDESAVDMRPWSRRKETLDVTICATTVWATIRPPLLGALGARHRPRPVAATPSRAGGTGRGRSVLAAAPALLLLAACEGDQMLHVRLAPFAWVMRDDLRGLPTVIPAGAIYVTEVSHRRDSGTEYTTRELAEEVALAKDAHVIVVATGEKSQLGEVMGPMWGRQNPTAVSNPIFVDVDGNVGYFVNPRRLVDPGLPGLDVGWRGLPGPAHGWTRQTAMRRCTAAQAASHASAADSWVAWKAMPFFTSARSIVLTTAARILSMMGLGVPFGKKKPCQPL